MVFFCCVHILGNATAQKVGFGFNGERRECVVGGGLRRRGRGWKKCFCIFGEEGSAIGGVEAFWKHNEGGTGTGGFQDAGARMGQIGGFVGS